MKNVYIPAEVEVIRLEDADVITTSPAEPGNDPLEETHNPNGWT